MDDNEIGHLIRHVKAGSDVKRAAMEIPLIEIDANIQPITRTVLRIRLSITPNFRYFSCISITCAKTVFLAAYNSCDFRWNDRVHGMHGEPFWIWVEDPDNNVIYHHEYYLVTKKQVKKMEVQEIVFTIPIFEPLPTQYIVRAISDRWVGSETSHAMSFKVFSSTAVSNKVQRFTFAIIFSSLKSQHLILPERHPPHTKLLDLRPLPVKALNNESFEALYKFDHFNPIQTQIFHTLYHTDRNVLLGAPTGDSFTFLMASKARHTCQTMFCARLWKDHRCGNRNVQGL